MMSEQKTGWHKLNYHERGERIAELEAAMKAGCEDMMEELPARTCGLADKYYELKRKHKALVEAALKLANTLNEASQSCANKETRMSVQWCAKQLRALLKETDDE